MALVGTPHELTHTPSFYLLVQSQAQGQSFTGRSLGALHTVEMTVEFWQGYPGLAVWVEHVGRGQSDECIGDRT